MDFEDREFKIGSAKFTIDVCSLDKDIVNLEIDYLDDDYNIYGEVLICVYLKDINISIVEKKIMDFEKQEYYNDFLSYHEMIVFGDLIKEVYDYYKGGE